MDDQCDDQCTELTVRGRRCKNDVAVNYSESRFGEEGYVGLLCKLHWMKRAFGGRTPKRIYAIPQGDGNG